MANGTEKTVHVSLTGVMYCSVVREHCSRMLKSFVFYARILVPASSSVCTMVLQQCHARGRVFEPDDRGKPPIPRDAVVVGSVAV